MRLDLSKHFKDGFAVLPMRWVVERTVAWLGNYRRLSKNYDIPARTEENVVPIAMLPSIDTRTAPT